MARVSPLVAQQQDYARSLVSRDRSEAIDAARPGAATGRRAEVTIDTLPWGVAFDSHDQQTPACDIIANLSEVEAEYAAIRTAAGMLDCPHRGLIVMSGKDRLDLLNRLVTQELKGLARGQSREAFWLNRKGRIEADLVVMETGDRTLLDVDVANASTTTASLGEFIFAEDAQMRDATDEYHHIALHGRRAVDALREAVSDPELDMQVGDARETTLAGGPVLAVRRDQTGDSGFGLIMSPDHAPRVWRRLLDAGVRPIGWHAFNIARIEAGEPLFNIDFGPTSLPHQSGVLERRVSFTKGCYLGQEIVARMHSRGHSKPSLAGLRVRSDALPVAGAQVFERQADGSMGEPVGAVTSSTLSPMLSAASIAFAMLKPSDPGRTVLVSAEGAQVEAVVGPLRHWSRSPVLQPAGAGAA